MAISDLVDMELKVSLAKKTHLDKSLDPFSANSILIAYDAHRRGGLFRLLPIQSQDFIAAGHLAWRSACGLRSLDALHLAVAARLGIPFATADERQAKAAKATGIACELVR
jgi:predicted nucleic acid-binding protein